MTRTTKPGRVADSSPGLATLTTSGGSTGAAVGQGASMYGYHTQGPWEVEYDGSLVVGGQIASGPIAPDTATRAEAMANSRLISAAPDLLAACEAVLAAATIETPAEVMRAVSQAVAKAKGGR